MPIKPENKERYPENWKAIRNAILERAEHRCEQCKAPNHERIARGSGRFADTYQMSNAEVYCANTGERLGRVRMSEYEVKNVVDIVLTIAHLDHVPENCDGMENGGPALSVEQSNLRAWCQRCHLKYDAAHHAETSKQTRRKALNNMELFDE